MESYRKIIIRLMAPNQPYTLDQIVSMVAQEVKPKIPGRASLQAEVSKMTRLDILEKFRIDGKVTFKLAEKFMRPKTNPFDMNRPAPVVPAEEPAAEPVKEEKAEPVKAEPAPVMEAHKKTASWLKKEKNEARIQRRRILPDFLKKATIPLGDIVGMSTECIVILAMVNHIYQNEDNPLITSGTLMLKSEGYFQTHQNVIFYLKQLAAKGKVNMETKYGVHVVTKVK